MLHDRFDRWGLGIASSSSAANRENTGRRWQRSPLIPGNTKDYLSVGVPTSFRKEFSKKSLNVTNSEKTRESLFTF